MNSRRAERLRLFESRVMHRADFEMRDPRHQPDEELASFLRFSNVEVLEIDRRQPLRARFALFPQLTFAHVSGPPSQIRWNRDRHSLDRVFAVITRTGNVVLSTDGVMLRRGRRISLLAPSDQPVTLDLEASENEFFYISVSPALIEGVALPVASSYEDEPADTSLLSPSVMFMAGLCRISTSSPYDASPLHMAAREIAKSVVTQIVGDARNRVGLFARAMELIVAEHPDPRLSVTIVAQRLGVASRTLQLAFSAEGTTVGAQIRDVRARAALRLHTTNPGLTYAAISRAVGFGSESALYRALRRVTLAPDEESDAGSGPDGLSEDV
ncbi:AraC family transcriptional regulator [Microbacterium sp. XT11]|uniref:AraC family transcriptional regulator n=1 Tax=Microbacterium sp. XT11 TaxID=367477 RepID=UPI0018DB5FC4|nr:helix-turn-helix domain-containing protein [Microbacterium sp. XT11]